MKKILLEKKTSARGETLVFKNTIKPRIPIAPVGNAHLSKKDRLKSKRIKITQFNWDKMGV